MLDLVGPAMDHTENLEKHWAFSDLMGSMSRIFFAVERSDVESGSTKKLTDFIDRIGSNLSLAEKLQGKVDITISGYNSDNRELWEIEEVRTWFRLAHSRVKYWFYFLCTDERAGGIKVLFACFCGIKTTKEKDAIGRKQIVFEGICAAKFLDANFPYLNEMTERLGMSMNQNKRITFDVMENIFGKEMIKPMRDQYPEPE